MQGQIYKIYKKTFSGALTWHSIANITIFATGDWWAVHEGTNSMIALGKSASGTSRHLFDNHDHHDVSRSTYYDKCLCFSKNLGVAVKCLKDKLPCVKF